MQPVIAVAAKNLVVAKPTIHGVVALSRLDRVIVFAAPDEVVSFGASDHAHDGVLTWPVGVLHPCMLPLLRPHNHPNGLGAPLGRSKELLCPTCKPLRSSAASGRLAEWRRHESG